MIDATLVLGIVITAGLLARWILDKHRECEQLRSALADAKQEATEALERCDRLAVELREEKVRYRELALELVAYREEDQRRAERFAVN